MISVASRTCWALLLLLLFGLAACEDGRVKRDDDDSSDRLRKQKLLERINEEIEEDKRRQIENELRESSIDALVANLAKLILCTIVIMIMMFAIYKCLKRNEEFYRNQGKLLVGMCETVRLTSGTSEPSAN